MFLGAAGFPTLDAINIQRQASRSQSAHDPLLVPVQQQPQQPINAASLPSSPSPVPLFAMLCLLISCIVVAIPINSACASTSTGGASDSVICALSSTVRSVLSAQSVINVFVVTALILVRFVPLGDAIQRAHIALIAFPITALTHIALSAVTMALAATEYSADILFATAAAVFTLTTALVQYDAYAHSLAAYRLLVTMSNATAVINDDSDRERALFRSLTAMPTGLTATAFASLPSFIIPCNAVSCGCHSQPLVDHACKDMDEGAGAHANDGDADVSDDSPEFGSGDTERRLRVEMFDFRSARILSSSMPNVSTSLPTGNSTDALSFSSTTTATAPSLISSILQMTNQTQPTTPLRSMCRCVCAICLSRLHAHAIIKLLPCNHRFHIGCLRPWLARRASCPSCRRTVR